MINLRNLVRVPHWLAVGLVLVGFPVIGAPKPPPNIIIFLVDDMGWQDTSVPF
ncbi:hypothetical protein [Spirosoma fluviale]|uniref:hypothetical protein n=1 Tax=Spirosoma fluviale TaxID=1597977 RepID=UPI001FE733A0|nr:hypothetical protein [Spirosoma fluviale]